MQADESISRPRGKQPLWITIVVLLLAAVGAWLKQSGNVTSGPVGDSQISTNSTPASAQAPAPARNSVLDAIRSHASDVVVSGSGRVVKVLPDDNEGARHERLLVEVAEGETVLIAHNIDLAPRIDVQRGDTIAFKGIYIWNDRGGVVHWTHHDPSGRHPTGFLQANGQTVR